MILFNLMVLHGRGKIKESGDREAWEVWEAWGDEGEIVKFFKT